MDLAGHHRIVFLSDIHANAHAFEAALETIRSMDVDKVVIMGDLLTYGCEPMWTLELLEATLEKWDTTLISGNHDQLYFNLSHRDLTYINWLPEWIRESVLWTKVEIASERILDLSLPWVEEFSIGDCFVAHANPHGFGNWSYLNTGEELIKAAEVLGKKGAKIGVFGHSHRPGIVTLHDNETMDVMAFECKYTSSEFLALRAIIANPGSIGQPRSQRRYPTFLSLCCEEGGIKLTLHEFSYDIEGHLESISKSPLSFSTKEKLMSFYKESL